MPTNDERREVAARLREKYREKYCPGVWQVQSVNDQIWMYLKDLEACLPDGYSAFNVLADLIEPEPERTCRNIASESDREWGNPFICSECGADPHDAESYYCGFSSGEHDWRFCPSCGAKVIRE